MSSVCLFSDDFQDGIWTKHPGNPVFTRDREWESLAICEPSVLFEDGVFKMWYMGCRQCSGYDASLGYATSRDGLSWEKHPGNPILTDSKDAIIRTTVIKHQGVYYLFASDYQWNEAAGVINRWTSKDGLTWTGKVAVLKPGKDEGQHDNTAVIVDEDGTWRMIFGTNGQGGPMGYAWSPDGVNWTKHPDNPVLRGFYGGDPFLRKIGHRYFVWYSRGNNEGLRIHCSWSTDLVNWTDVYHNPQINFTQPWERGQERPEAHWNTHLTDAELLEHDGRVLMYYQGAQCPLGVAFFEGTFEQLAERMMRPPLSRWADIPHGSVENKELKISGNETDKIPLVEKSAVFGDQPGYAFEFRGRCYAGPSQQIKAVMRYVDERNYARFWIADQETTWYQECLDGQLGGTANIGPNHICDRDWHQWRIIVRKDLNELYLDGRRIGERRSSRTLVGQQDLKIGFSVFDTYAAFADVRVKGL